MRREDEVDRRHFKKTSFTLSSVKYDSEDTRSVFDLIRGMNDQASDTVITAFKERLEASGKRIDLTDLFNAQGHTALTYAAQQGKTSAIQAMFDFVKQKSEKIATEVSLSHSGSEKEFIDKQIKKTLKRSFKNTLVQWINLRDRTDIRASALHLAAF